MAKGLKQMAEEASGDTPVSPDAEIVEQVEALPPIKVAGEAQRALSFLLRQWSGDPRAVLKFGKPVTSPFAEYDQDRREFTANIDTLVMNPNRVLNTVTPFRLRQEAVLTGVLLHECGHARFSKWAPTGGIATHGLNPTAAGVVDWAGKPATKQAVALARLMEEPRVEGLIAREADGIGAAGLGWTMRASGARLTPMTNLSADPAQAIMDLIGSWALRAGKRLAYGQWTKTAQPSWVNEFTTLVHGAFSAHLATLEDPPLSPDAEASRAINLLVQMTVVVDDIGTTMLDMAQGVLDILFPETDGDDDGAPMPKDQHGDAAQESESESGDGGEGDEEEAEGEGNTEPEDEGEGDDPGAGDTGDDDAEESEKGSDGDGDGEPDESDQDEDPEPDSGAGTDKDSVLAKALAALEADATDETEAEAEGKQEGDDMVPGGGAGGGKGKADAQGFRPPSKEEREVGKGAERFLRSLIEPTDSATVKITDTPSSSIDGAAYEAWAASGRVRAPHFFKRTRRKVEPSPPVRIAILADRSSSMDELQYPTALLSWALSSGCMDLANFAGRGQQIESCLIHWGSTAEVIQGNGAPVPGIKEYDCHEGTYALDAAMDLVEQEMPGFFDISPTPVNRLLVQFTDWELYGGQQRVTRQVQRALEAGVNMLNVVPRGYRQNAGCLPQVLAACRVQRGHSTLLRYNENYPQQVWDAAAGLLNEHTPGTVDGGLAAPFPGF